MAISIEVRECCERVGIATFRLLPQGIDFGRCGLNRIGGKFSRAATGFNSRSSAVSLPEPVLRPVSARGLSVGCALVSGIDDLQRVLTEERIGERVAAVVLREGRRLALNVAPVEGGWRGRE